MSFEQSTQCKSWMFSEKSLKLCREKAACETIVARKQNGEVRVRKYASGFKPTSIKSVQSPRSVQLIHDFLPPSPSLSSDEQDILVRFHAHQISMLVGPDAILPCLIRSETVFSTSIMIFRRFYLSNSVLDFPPRAMAVASCFLASKLEENRIEVSSRRYVLTRRYVDCPSFCLFLGPLATRLACVLFILVDWIIELYSYVYMDIIK